MENYDVSKKEGRKDHILKKQELVKPSIEKRRQLFSKLMKLENENERKRRQLYKRNSKYSDNFKGLIAETQCFFTSSNAEIRDEIQRLLSESLNLRLENVVSSKEDKAYIRVSLLQDYVRENKFKNPFFTRNFAGNPKKSFGSEWKTAASEKNIENFVAINEAIGFNSYVYARSRNVGSNVLSDGIENFGFCFVPSYPFDEPDTPDRIVFEDGVEGGKAIKRATLDKLIEHLTHEQHSALAPRAGITDMRSIFLLTYHSFTTPEILLDRLIDRFNVPVPPNLTPSEIMLFKKNVLDRIQIKVCSVLKRWVEDHYSDFEQNAELQNQVNEHLDQMLKMSASKLSSALSLGLKKSIEKRSSGKYKVATVDDRKFLPLFQELPIGELKFGDIHPLDLARQLTLLDFEKFKAIHPRECLNKSWMKKDKEDSAPNIIFLSRQFNMVSFWVQKEILSHADPDHRAAAWKRFMKIVKHLLELHNFHSTFAMVAGFNSNSVFRLSKTKEHLAEKHIERLEDWKNLASPQGSYKRYRKELTESIFKGGPRVPYIGVFLQDLNFIEDGNKDEIEGMINFDKRSKLAERISWIKQCQEQSYGIKKEERIQHFLQEQLKICNGDEFYVLSLEREPRGS